MDHITNTLIFVDWDDTLFPTEWTKTSNVDLNDPSTETINMFNELDKLVTDLIVNMVPLGSILIVTNGSESWVKCCLNVLPNFKQIIDHDVISVTSARDLFSEEHEVDDWKKLTFKMFFNEHISTIEGTFRILSFGDSESEHRAVSELKTYLPVDNQNRIIGTIKFLKYPSLNDLVTQLQIVKMLNEEIVAIDNDHVYELENFIL